MNTSRINTIRASGSYRRRCMHMAQRIDVNHQKSGYSGGVLVYIHDKANTVIGDFGPNGEIAIRNYYGDILNYGNESFIREFQK